MKDLRNLLLRSVTGIVYVAVIVLGILLPLPALWILVFVIAVCATYEFHRLAVHLGASPDGNLQIFDTLGVLVVSLMPAAFDSPKAWLSMGLFLLLYLLIRPVVALYDKDQMCALRSYAFSMGGLIYVGVPLLCMGIIDLMTGGPWLLLGMFIVIWLSDTGAFVVGSLMGRHKLFERLSPKKSWEGFFGGLAFCAGGGAIYWLCARPHLPESLTIVEMVFLGVVVCVFATWGDLFESLLKRTAAVKDSGAVLPGHGGVLDRVDSLMFVAPASLIYYLLTLVG